MLNIAVNWGRPYTSAMFRRAKKPKDFAAHDAMVIQQLREAGADLAQPLAVDLFLYFPTEIDASTVAELLSAEGYSTRAGRAAVGENWVVEAKKETIVTLDAITSARATLTSLATSRNGEYDGWGAAVRR